MIFSTKKNPKGPNIKKLEQHAFNLSGHVLNLELPAGNCFDIPNPQGQLKHNSNIYNHESLHDKSSTIQIIADRSFKYTGLLGENLGRVRFLMQARLIKDSDVDLTVVDELKKYINNTLDDSFKEWNATADEFAQIEGPEELIERLINANLFIYYEIYSATKTRSCYSIAVSHNSFITMEFAYTINRRAEDPWLRVARELEAKVMNSIEVNI
jgi:hypothetical protein